MTKKQKRMLVRIIISFVLFAALMVAEHTGALEGINTWILFVIYLVPYLVIGYDIVYKAVLLLQNAAAGRCCRCAPD